MEKDKQLAEHKLKEVVRISQTNLLAESISDLTEEQKTAIRFKAVEEVINIESEARRRSDIGEEARRETQDHITTVHGLGETKRPGVHTIRGTIKTGTGERKITSSTCFVATAAFESSEALPVVQLRCWREDYLAHISLGRKFISFYYKNGPKLAVLLNNKPLLKPLVRQVLRLIAYLATLHLARRKY